MERPSDEKRVEGPPRFRVARNPDAESRLPYLIWLPIEGGLVLKARETWPRANRVFCTQDARGWDESVGLLEDVAVLLCRRRGAAIDLVLERRALPAVDYAAIVGEAVVAAIERKTLENLATSLSDGSLAFQLQRLAELPKAAIVVEGDYPDLFRTQPGRGSWLADMLGRLAVRYPEVPVVFAGSRKFAEEWAYRFLGAAVADHTESS